MPTAEVSTVPSKPIVHPIEVQQEVIRLHGTGLTVSETARRVGLPRQTCLNWITKGQTKSVRQRITMGINRVVTEAVAAAKDIASQEIDKLLARQLALGNAVMAKAELVVNHVAGLKHASQLASAANSAKIGVGLSRQALGLCDTTEKVIVRVDLIGRAEQQVGPTIDVQSSTVAQPTAISTPACTLSQPDTARDKDATI